MDWAITTAESNTAVSAVQELWTEYWQALGLSPCFQNFSEELRTLPGKYSPPQGRLLVLSIDGNPAGTAAFRRLNDRACEAKRLYVRPAYRRLGAARALLARLIEEARSSGYQTMYGDTLPQMTSALVLYRELGFVEVCPYSDEPTPGAVYLRLNLD
jgi:GNAT superfamily N-acetyltransferase